MVKGEGVHFSLKLATTISLDDVFYDFSVVCVAKNIYSIGNNNLRVGKCEN